MTLTHTDFTAVATGAVFNDRTRALEYKYELRQRPQPQLFSFLPYTASTIHQPPTYSAPFSYNPEHLGFPSDQSPPQQTDPFWQQHDFCQAFTQPQHIYPVYGYTHYNHIYDPFTTMDFTPIFIGSNTAHGKVIAGDSARKRGPKNRRNELMNRSGVVSLYIGEVYIDDLNVKDLIRFSKTIGNKFATPKEGEGEASAESTAGFTVEVTKNTQGHRSIKLVNSGTEIWVLPPAWAFAEVLLWVDMVRNLSREAELPHFHVAAAQDYTLHDRISVYAAATILGLRPHAVLRSFRGEIFHELSYVPSTAADFKFVHERLPVGDSVLKKMVLSFFVHGERNHYRRPNQRGEVTRVMEYVKGCDHQEFQEMYIQIMHQRAEAKVAELEGEKGGEKGNWRGKGKDNGNAKNGGQGKGKGKAAKVIDQAEKPTAEATEANDRAATRTAEQGTKTNGEATAATVQAMSVHEQAEDADDQSVVADHQTADADASKETATADKNVSESTETTVAASQDNAKA